MPRKQFEKEITIEMALEFGLMEENAFLIFQIGGKK